jgi:hypothetical protein
MVRSPLYAKAANGRRTRKMVKTPFENEMGQGLKK